MSGNEVPGSDVRRVRALPPAVGLLFLALPGRGGRGGIELADLIRLCLRYHAMFIVFGSVRRHKNSDYSKKATKLMRKYEKYTNM